MKDLSLSLLSRGCGRFVSSNKNTGRHDGRLDVCFTPQDYYIWKSRDSRLRLSSSGRLLVEAESTLPKTYSTRRGPLLLYSQDLVTMEASCDSKVRDRKQREVRQYTQQGEQQLNTLKELSAAILGYGNAQFTSSRLGPLFFPPLHFPAAPDLHQPSPPSPHTAQEQPSPELLVQSKSRWYPADKEEKRSSSKTVRLDLFLQIPSTSRTPTPQRDPQTWVHYAAMTPEEPEEPQTGVDRSLQLSESSHHTDINHHSSGGDLHHPNVHDVANDWDGSKQDSGKTGGEENCDRVISGNRCGRTGVLPPLTAGHPVCNGEKTDRLRWNSPSRDDRHTLRLPPIAESRTVRPGRAPQVHNQQDTQPKADRVHQQALFLPLLFPAKEEETSGKQRGGDKPERHFYKKATVGPGEGGSVIQLNPGEEPPPPAGVLGCVAGRKGPGKQSSLAFLQNRLLDLQDPCEPSESDRGVVRGVLPLELRDLQNGKSVGSLILGPDGEIIQLSLYACSQDPSQAEESAQERALQVLSADGEKLPWVIVLQPEHAHTDGEMELDTDVPVGNVEHHQSTHRAASKHRASCELQLADVSRATDAGSLSSHTHSVRPAAATKNETKGAEAAKTAWTKDDQSNVRTPPPRERGGEEETRGGRTEAEEETRGGGTEAEEEEEEEELGRTGAVKHPSGQQNRSPTEATERTHGEEAAAASGKREMKTDEGAATDGQKTSRTKREGSGQATGSDAQPIRSQKQEGRGSRETQDRTPPPAAKKKIREGETGEVKMKEEREEVKRQKEESAERRRRRRRRGRLEHKDSEGANPERPLKKEEEETSQVTEEESNLKPTRSRSATRRHNNKTETDPEEDADTEPLHDKHSSVQSVSSLRSQLDHRSSRRSAASSSCEAAAAGLASSRGRLSSCSTVMITEEQLMLNPVKPESSRPRRSQQQQQEAAALRRAQRAERRRQEEERRRREQEEEQQEREQTEDRMRSELDGERRRRAEELRRRKLAQEEERRRHEEEEQERARREQAQRDGERRRLEERRRQMERLQRMREEEEQRRRAEVERRRLEEEQRQEEEDRKLQEENRKLQEMDERERTEYLCRRKQEEEERRSREEEQRRREEEAAVQAAEEARLQAALLARQMALLQQQLAFKRGLVLESGGLEKTQGISRPWVYSYFTLLQLLGLNKAQSPDL